LELTDEEKGQVLAYREQGLGYKKIASILGVTENTIKGFCKRQVAVKEIPILEEKIVVPIAIKHICRNCGIPVEQNSGRKEKKFCSDRCRMSWWNSHAEQVNRKANYEIVCPNCKKKFISYGNKERRYCCHDCYLEDRYGRN
jgi:endogenous inhibitor of DNA gyrase (YacG/DUF329 family)